MTEMANWKPVVGYEGLYEVSDTGFVRGLDRLSHHGVRVEGRVLARRRGVGYRWTIRPAKDGRQAVLFIDRLVLEAFVGPRPTGMDCIHGDGNTRNAALSNLQWGIPTRRGQEAIDGERWRPVVGFEGSYEVSDYGRVRSLPRRASNGRRLGARILKSQATSYGYLCVFLYRDNGPEFRKVHTLVLEAFVGPAPAGQICRHLDGNPANPSLMNLKWGTHSENNLDQVAHGTHPWASKTHCAHGHPLTGDNVRARITKSGWNSRTCIACERDRVVRRRAEREALKRGA